MDGFFKATTHRHESNKVGNILDSDGGLVLGLGGDRNVGDGGVGSRCFTLDLILRHTSSIRGLSLSE